MVYQIAIRLCGENETRTSLERPMIPAGPTLWVRDPCGCSGPHAIAILEFFQCFEQGPHTMILQLAPEVTYLVLDS